MTIGICRKGKEKTKLKKKELSKKAKQALVIAQFSQAVAESSLEEAHAHSSKGLYVSGVMKDADRKMHKQDEQRMRAAQTVQRHFRAKLKARRARKKVADEGRAAEDDNRGSSSSGLSKSVTRMLSKTVEAPAYFGESCLWIPFDDWDIVPPPMYMYSARCETRGELIMIAREDIQELILKFSPWLAERFEYFREAVVEGYINEDGGAETVGSGPIEGGASYRLPIPIDWAAADLDLPEQETIPIEAFHHEALHRVQVPDRRPLRQREDGRPISSRTAWSEDARAGLQGPFRRSGSHGSGRERDWVLPPVDPISMSRATSITLPPAPPSPYK